LGRVKRRASIGPIVAFGESVLDLENGIFEFIYAPVIWLHDTTMLEEPLEEYAELWA